MDPSSEDLPQRRRSHGCLWGCLGVVLFFIVAVGGTVGYMAWNLYQGFGDDPHLQAILVIAHNSEMVRDEFGGKVFVTEVDRNSFPLPRHDGHATTYRLVLIGRNGQGELNARLETKAGQTKTLTIILTCPDGRTRALVGKEPQGPLSSI